MEDEKLSLSTLGSDQSRLAPLCRFRAFHDNTDHAVRSTDGHRINGHRVVAKPRHGFDLIKVVEENFLCCASA